ncbi:tryptophan synthase subunit alpha [Clostridium chrysemydis]|uniref:tryptophan synthase subunit alpha n=1 Tax=Clostridium chrysemydis TaxID=2665504 RepID=UPI00188395FE|nr:tryptophan synthase subunit alpha [Clostridium chrysemydis]
MNKLKEVLKEDKKYLTTFTVGGYPNIEKSKEIILNLYKSGSDIIEVGLPYKEALADGEVIKEAYDYVLQNNIKIDDIFNMIKSLKEFNIPIVIMSYYNLIYCYGIDLFVEKLKESGVDGLIVPDLPLEESLIIKEKLEKEDICYIPLVTRTSKERIKNIVDIESGFIYAVSVNGTTGGHFNISFEIENYIYQIRKFTNKKIFLGFGISNIYDVLNIKDNVDGVIIGSKILKIIRDKGDYKEFINEIKKVLN